MQTFNKKYICAAAFACLAAALNAQNFDLDAPFKSNTLRYTQDNYIEPATQEAAPQPAPATGGDVDPAGPWMICEIKTEGLKNIRAKTITKNISARDGRLYYRSSVHDDVSALMALGNFDAVDIDISPSGGAKKNKEDKEDADRHPCHRLTVIAEEKPVFDKIIYKGRKALSKSAIQNAMSLKIKDPYSQSRLAADMEKIKAAYAEKGYINAQPSFATQTDSAKNIVIATITIDEGQKTRVKEVVVEGLHEIPAKKFISKLSNRPRKIYKTQKMPEDNYKSTIYARNLGYYDFKILDYTADFSEDKSHVVLTYKIDEGKKAVFGDSSFTGNTVYTDKQLKDTIFYKKGKKFNQQKFDITMRDLQEKYADKGYLRADINPVRTLDAEGRLNIQYDITENNVVFIDHIDITGNESTKTYVFARELTIKEGEIFSYSKVKRSQNKILNLGFINDAQIDISPTNDPGKVDVGYNVVEGRPGMFTAGVAMSSLDGLYGDVSINHLNLFGRAQRLSLRALFGSRILDYTVSWSTPWIFEKPVSFGVDAFNTRRYRSYRGTSSAYTQKQTGGRLHVGPRFNDDIYNLNFSYTFENIKISDIADPYAHDKWLEEGTVNVSTLGASFAIDTRDNYWDPTEGARNSLGADISGGPAFGDLDIYHLNFKSSYNYTLLNIGKDYPIVLMIANRAGLVKPYGRTDIVPAWERAFIGGADTVRGYDNSGQIGPETGGEIYYIGNAELKFPLAREGRRTIAQFALFFDIGNSWNEWNKIRFKTGEEENEFKTGVGFGLRFVTPSLPIRLDWGYGLNHRTGERKSQIYFSMANLF
ncbi:MAG: outer membrane protein assembly factor BamA [Elusimicrobiota bacterium]|jgi:outer membrane protein insertion porin family|nr:outer membrane protein assembly factor BamA [Elusimicrobiota bacterium]